MSGYAYTGGGRKVTRVEVSLDDGVSWQQAGIKVYEEPNSYGAFWVGLRWAGGVLKGGKGGGSFVWMSWPGFVQSMLLGGVDCSHSYIDYSHSLRLLASQ